MTLSSTRAAPVGRFAPPPTGSPGAEGFSGLEIDGELEVETARPVESCVHLLQVAMTTDPFITDHLFVPLGMTVKQLSALRFQVVQ